MFDTQGSAYLVDFGIAKLLEASRAITTSGVVLGTPLFMPPEQWRAEQVTPSADQYALGVMTYLLVTGHVPFNADTPHGLMYQHLSETPASPQVFRPDIPDDVAPVLQRALAKDPGKRFPTVTGFVQSFEQSDDPLTGLLGLDRAQIQLVENTHLSTDFAQWTTARHYTHVGPIGVWLFAHFPVFLRGYGLLLKTFVSEANYYDGTVGRWLLPGLRQRFPRLKKLWADGTYAGEFVEQARDAYGIEVEVTSRLAEQPGFQVIPRRWVVERTFGWFNTYRRLSKDYEYWVYTSDVMLYAASVHLITRRLARLKQAA